MARVQNRPGNPQKIINWKFVDESLEAGCDGKEIAACLGIHPSTLYERCDQEKGTNWASYLQSKRADGLRNLRHAQYKKAMGKHEGDANMQKWLGIHWLGQRETPQEVTVTEVHQKVYDDVLSKIDDAQARKTEEIKDNTVAKSE